MHDTYRHMQHHVGCHVIRKKTLEKTCQVKRPVEDAPSFQSFVQRRFWAMVKPPEAETWWAWASNIWWIMWIETSDIVCDTIQTPVVWLALDHPAKPQRVVPPMWLGQESRNKKSPQSNSQEMSSVSRPQKNCHKIRTWRSIRIVDLLDWRSSGISVLCLDLRLRQQKATLERDRNNEIHWNTTRKWIKWHIGYLLWHIRRS